MTNRCIPISKITFNRTEMPIQTYEKIRHQRSSERTEEERAAAEDAEVDARLQAETDRRRDIEKSLAEVIDNIDVVLAA